MKFEIPYKISFVLLLASLSTAYGQERDENIGTQVVNVVKPYTPTISDAFKVKETPNLDDDETAQKETIRYFTGNSLGLQPKSTGKFTIGHATALIKRLAKLYTRIT